MEGFRDARRAVDAFLAQKLEDGPTSAADLEKDLLRRRGAWMGDDPTFGIEIAVLSAISGSMSIERVTTLLREALPAPGEVGDVAESHAKVVEISEQSWLVYAHEDARTILTTIKDMLYELTENRCPDGTSVLWEKDWYKPFLPQIDRFVMCEMDDGKVLCGKSALVAMMEIFFQRIAKKDHVGFDDIEVVSCFEFLLDAPNRKRATELRDAVIALLSTEGTAGDARMDDGAANAAGGTAASDEPSTARAAAGSTVYVAVFSFHLTLNLRDEVEVDVEVEGKLQIPSPS